MDVFFFSFIFFHFFFQVIVQIGVGRVVLFELESSINNVTVLIEVDYFIVLIYLNKQMIAKCLLIKYHLSVSSKKKL